MIYNGGDIYLTKHLSIKSFDLSLAEDCSEAEELRAIFDQLNSYLSNYGMNLKNNALAINLFITDMSKFPDLNNVYKQYFGLKPPTRACVALPK